MKKFGLLSVLSLGIILISAGFGNKPKDRVKLSKSFTSKYAYIPGGQVSLETAKTEVGAFFMLKTEVSNAQYIEFLNAIEDNNLKSQYAIKNEKWSQSLKSGGPYSEHYHTHEAYSDYPVVNITRAAAEAYCNWLTEKYTSMDIGLSDDMKIVFRLPTRAEWVHAANGELNGSYAWGGPYVRNTQGQFLANFNRIGPENIHRNPETDEYEIVPLPIYMGLPGNLNENADILAPVDSYAPNGYELVNMNGNVAEIVSDQDKAAGGSWRSPGYDIRNESLMEFNEASPEVGFRPIGTLTKK